MMCDIFYSLRQMAAKRFPSKCLAILNHTISFSMFFPTWYPFGLYEMFVHRSSLLEVYQNDASFFVRLNTLFFL